jgi:signal transduction histidine kinase
MQPSSFIEEVLALYQGHIAQLELQIEPNLPMLYADPVRLRQVLINLVKNAQEAIADGRGDHIEVSARAIQDDELIELRVQDNGPGLDRELAHQIFEPYVTTKSKGTGLGLAIVKKIVEEHGGNIWVESKPEQGACFIIRLPSLNPHSAQIDSSHPPTQIHP